MSQEQKSAELEFPGWKPGAQPDVAKVEVPAVDDLLVRAEVLKEDNDQDTTETICACGGPWCHIGPMLPVSTVAKLSVAERDALTKVKKR